MTTLTKWIPTTNLVELRRLGKLLEELGEATAVAGRCIIQGLCEIDPSTGVLNKTRLEQELADVDAQIACCVDALRLDATSMNTRTCEKLAQMREWEDMFK